MRKTIKLILALFVMFSPLAGSIFAKEKDIKKILFIAGNTKHRHGFHEYKAGSILLANALNESGLPLEAKVHWYGWPEDESILNDLDALVIFADSGCNLTEEQYQIIDKKVKGGMGLMYMHYALHPDARTKEEVFGKKYLKPWLGGYFGNKVTVNSTWVAEITPNQDHSTSNGIEKPIKLMDELYFCMNFDKSSEFVSLGEAIPKPENMIRYGSRKFWNQNAVDQLGKPQTMIWAKDSKTQGRAAAFVGGHYHNNWAIDDFRKLILNTITWVSGVEVPAKGVESAKITKEILNKNLNRPDYPEKIELPSTDFTVANPAKIYPLDETGRAIDPRKKNTSLKKKPQANEAKQEQRSKKPSVKDAYPWPVKKFENVDLDLFDLGDDLEITRWGASPQLYNPTNMDIDQKGRIWLTEAVNYRRQNTFRRAKGDRIVVLVDSNGDGQADESHVFHQDANLSAPLGIAIFDNKVIVSQPPELIVYTDVNRNLKFEEGVDKKEILLTGFNGRQHDHSLHSVTAGPDGKFYFNSGNCGAIFTDKSGKTFRMNAKYRGGALEEYFYVRNHELNGAKSDDGFVWTSGFTVRMNPDGSQAEIVGHGYRNSYEQTINSLGEVFQSDNDDYSSCRNSYVLEYGSAGYYSRDGEYKWQSERRPGQAIPRAHWRQDNPGTFDAGDVYGAGGPTGVCFYENGALGEKWQGMYLSCEATRNIVYGYHPEQQGATYKMERFKFLTSHGKKQSEQALWFRPSDVAVGPEGAIYIADWYDARSGGHGTLDPTASGAIFRIAPKGFKPVIPKFDLSTIEGQIEALKNPAVNVRYLGFKALKESGIKALPQILKLLKHENKYVAARGIWLLPYIGEIGKQKCIDLLDSKDAHVRLVAYRALRRADINVLPFAAKLANDSNAAVRRDVALSLRHFSAEETGDIFVNLVKNMGSSYDKNYVEAIGLGSENKETAIWNSLKAGLDQQNPQQWSEAFARITWRLGTPAAVKDLKSRVTSTELSQEKRLFAVESLAFIKDKSAALALIDLAKEESPIKKDITQWIFNRRLTDWSKLDIAEEVKSIYDPAKFVVNAMTVPEEPEVKTLDQEKILTLKGNASRGKQKIMSCTMCHQINDMGPNYGPMLKGWASKQTTAATINAIVAPSKGIAHGFKGIEVTLKNGDKVQGIAESMGDPMILVSTGGIRQIIPKERIVEQENMKRSLMLSAQQLGLSEQDVADIVEYMKNWQ
ncbi:MAG: ThuA domain-containing protein [Lentisphaerales bacterium]|nr:ThuA domain-containing protein [Lentisphaerales bacterium]